MKNILGIIGSPRRLGNCELMVKAVSRRIDFPHRLRLLRLTEFNLRPCRACYRCLFEDRCPIDDDHQTVVEALLASDALIVAMPTYFLGPNACLKRFVDRGLSLYPHIEALWGQPAVAVGVAGIPGREGYTLLGIESALRLMFADVRAQKVVYGALPGEVFLDATNLAAAGELAAALFQPVPPAAGPRCPLCGGTTFRFLDRDQIRCMLCSNAGRLVTEGRDVSVTITSGPHELFLTREDALAHRQWLMDMKARFQAQKKSLQAIVRNYRGEDDWIRPPTAPKAP